MAYFNHAFQKAFLADSVAGGASSTGQPVGTNTSALTPGSLALVDTTYDALANAGSGVGLLMIAQGSFHTDDIIGNNPGHGGYTESTKSKGINPKYVTKVWHSCCAEPTPSVLTAEACGECFPCGYNFYFRLDVKGSPALRFLNHNAYTIADLGGYCCEEGQDYIDPTIVMVAYAAALAADPIVSPFIVDADNGIAPYVEYSTNGGTNWIIYDESTYTPTTDPDDDNCARLIVTGAYVETKFGDCSFDTRDHYNKEPVQLSGSAFYASSATDPTDATFSTCLECVDVTTVAGTMSQTQGETVIRDILMTENYMQNPYNQGNADSARIREIEGSDQVLNAVDRTALYDRWYMLHTVPRFNNPSGVFDNDQYLYSISALCDSDAAADVAVLMESIAKEAGVTVEEDCDLPSGS
tara:strand:+ start:4190 stop:5422 length:1233 start_codon:yes stop_codon:yes gene_type:complete